MTLKKEHYISEATMQHVLFGREVSFWFGEAADPPPAPSCSRSLLEADMFWF